MFGKKKEEPSELSLTQNLQLLAYLTKMIQAADLDDSSREKMQQQIDILVAQTREQLRAKAIRMVKLIGIVTLVVVLVGGAAVLYLGAQAEDLEVNEEEEVILIEA